MSDILEVEQAVLVQGDARHALADRVSGSQAHQGQVDQVLAPAHHALLQKRPPDVGVHLGVGGRDPGVELLVGKTAVVRVVQNAHIEVLVGLAVLLHGGHHEHVVVAGGPQVGEGSGLNNLDGGLEPHLVEHVGHRQQALLGLGGAGVGDEDHRLALVGAVRQILLRQVGVILVVDRVLAVADDGFHGKAGGSGGRASEDIVRDALPVDGVGKGETDVLIAEHGALPALEAEVLHRAGVDADQVDVACGPVVQAQVVRRDAGGGNIGLYKCNPGYPCTAIARI